MAGMLDPNVFVHGPGDSNCGTTDQCYYFPIDISTAYATTFIPNNNGGAGFTIAIVDAFDSPNAEADLNVFSNIFGLPACTTLNGCFKKVNQFGATSPLPVFNAGWAIEIGLDLQWAHAIAPNAKILLIETNTNSFANLNQGVLTGGALADVISNSYGAREFGGENGFDGIYAASTVPVLFSSGDIGGVTQYPCTSPNVVCVGGTSLVETSTSHRNIERGWSFGGGGCSPFEVAPGWQFPYSSSFCGGSRGAPDIAGPADPNTGALVYYSPLSLLGAYTLWVGRVGRAPSTQR
jgi:subtilase family serine protease